MQSGLSCNPYSATAAFRLLKNCSTTSGVEYSALFDSSADGLRVEILYSHRLRNPYSQHLLSVFSESRFPRWCANSPPNFCMAVLP
ncbi:hypothetical protein DPMN_183685 [Dreissena polymorpha]|uniref:Uncharacterized protein n=1 Tax=Dreissena polymorpha TaxID=45954 RepID=A0A9D4DKE1_DREPO|nr:hypothetical protein DPMN_183685 [Dreissena polymorpha]